MDQHLQGFPFEKLRTAGVLQAGLSARCEQRGRPARPRDTRPRVIAYCGVVIPDTEYVLQKKNPWQGGRQIVSVTLCLLELLSTERQPRGYEFGEKGPRPLVRRPHDQSQKTRRGGVFSTREPGRWEP